MAEICSPTEMLLLVSNRYDSWIFDSSNKVEIRPKKRRRFFDDSKSDSDVVTSTPVAIWVCREFDNDSCDMLT